MGRYILITRPEHDYTTRYISAWAEKILDFIKSRGDFALDLSQKRAVKKELESMLRKKDPSLVLFNGHGSDTYICGQNDEILIEAGINETMLKSRIVYALSCRSARILGHKSVENGALAYIGYSEDFIFMYSSEKRGHPIEDKIAALFLEPSNQVVISLLKGHTAGEANENSKKAFLRNIQKLLTSETTQEDSATLRYLFWDMQHQVCLGDRSATL